ncbi:MAG: nucleotidyltransferase domain-containing protein [Bryobacteraceae bacterium]
MERVLNQLLDKLKKAYGDHLVSVVLYGSAAVGDQDRRFSDINVLCVLDRVTPDELAHSDVVFRWWHKMENPAPLLMSEEEVAASADCFPIEFHDIQTQHRLLYGKDVITGLRIDDRHYRAEVEHELRSKLLRLRQKASATLVQNDLLLQLMAESVSTFCVLFRHALRLNGIDAKMVKREVIEQAREAWGLRTEAFETLLDLREGRVRTRRPEAVPLLASYLKEISVAIDAVDRLGK